MKKTITAFTAGFLLSFPLLCSAAYVIHLKDGRSFETSEYQTEGDLIRFKRYGGIIGLPRDQVVEIEEIEDEPKKEIPVAQKPPPPPQSEKKISDAEESPPKSSRGEKEKKAPDKQKEDAQIALMKEKRRILLERENVSQAFRDAKAANDQKKKDLYWNRLLQIQNELQRLQKKVADENEGVVPEWWEEIR